MRKRHAQIVVLVALVAVTTLSVTGQEEPLPAVHARPWSSAAGADGIRYVAIAVEPIREFVPPTMAEAVRRNDYVTFNALYTAAKSTGEDVRAFEALHDLWTWSMHDPIGAFYGTELHARLASAYPGFRAFIENYRIVDSHGSVFYPTSETRTFLLEYATAGRSPRVQIADATNTSRVATSSQPPAREPLASAPARETTATATHAATPARARTAEAPASRRSPATTVPSSATTRPAAVPAAIATAEATAATTTPVVPAIADATPPVIAPDTVTPATVVTAPATPLSAPGEQRPIARESAFANRGILLLVIGIVGIGLLAVMLRTPREDPMPSILQPPLAPPAEKPATRADNGPGTVEPMRQVKGEKRAS